MLSIWTSLKFCSKPPFSMTECEIENLGKVHWRNIARRSYMKFHPIWSRVWGEIASDRWTYRQMDGRMDGPTKRRPYACP